jgi:hypothetical protein
MKTRNFKVRIHNLNLKKVFFLESATDQYSLRLKYTKYLVSLGYNFVRSHATSRNVKSYHFYPNALFKTRVSYYRQFPSRIRLGRNLHAEVNTKPKMLNPYMVLLEIIELPSKHKQKILQSGIRPV